MSNGPIRIAHLILTHKNPAQLGRMLKALYHEAFDFYIHVDAKADIAPFLPLGELPNVYFIKNRARVAWADFGTIQATLNGWREILPLGKHDYINVISGQDFPVRSAETIYRFIASRNGQEFITCESIDGPNWNVGPRVRNYHLINWRIPGKFRLEKILNKVLPERKFPVDHVWVGRANWFTLSAKAIQYCLDFLRDHPKVVRYYKYCWGADEFIFSTILYNSPVFRDRIVDNLVYVDWPTPGAGHPKMLDAGDIEKLKATDKMFARKMDLTTDPELFRLLEEWIGNKISQPS